MGPLLGLFFIVVNVIYIKQIINDRVMALKDMMTGSVVITHAAG